MAAQARTAASNRKEGKFGFKAFAADYCKFFKSCFVGLEWKVNPPTEQYVKSVIRMLQPFAASCPVRDFITR